MLSITVQDERLYVGERFSMSFQRTIRIPDDGNQYPLPPGLGKFPIKSVAEFSDNLPPTWQGENSFFIPMYQREALWLGFDGADWKPNAVKIAVGRVNAISGERWNEGLTDQPQNYIVTPNQPWLDGIKVGEGSIRQFVAMPLGLGYTVEAQVRGNEEFGGIQIVVYEPKPGKFPDEPPPQSVSVLDTEPLMSIPFGMGVGAGGQIQQKIYPDPYGVDTWDTNNYGTVTIHIVNSEQYQQITRCEPPPSRISAATYTEYGLPWFDLYDEHKVDIPTSETLKDIKSIQKIEQERGIPTQPGDESLTIDESMIQKLHLPPDAKKTVEED